MAKLTPLKVPFINANEDEALLASLECREDQLVKSGDLLAVLETTKSTVEVQAERDGFVVGLMAAEGDTLRVNQVWAYLADTAGARDDTLPPWAEEKADKTEIIPARLEITTPAMVRARRLGVDLSKLPTDELITTIRLNEILASKEECEASTWVEQPAENNGRLLVYGAGGHGRSLVELIRLLPDITIEGFVDDGVRPNETLLGLPILGGKDALQRLFDQGITQAVNGVGGIGNPAMRCDVFKALTSLGFYCPRVIHPSAIIERTAQLANAVQVFPMAYVGSQAQVGFGTIINTQVVVSHDCVLGEVVNLSPGATLAGGVEVGDGVLIGMRATINLNVKIGKGARIGNGATVKADVPDRGIVPAGTIWPRHS